MEIIEINERLSIKDISKIQHKKEMSMLTNKDLNNTIQVSKKGKSKLQTPSIDGKLDSIERVDEALNQKRFKFVF